MHFLRPYDVTTSTSARIRFFVSGFFERRRGPFFTCNSFSFAFNIIVKGEATLLTSLFFRSANAIVYNRL